MADDIAQHMEGVARALLGEPNRAMSSKTELRFGTSGSLSIDLKKSTAFDHEAEEGGGVLWLIHRCTGLANGGAIDWMREHGFAVEDRRQNGGGAPIEQSGQRRAGERRELEATYDYVDEEGGLLYQVCRWVFVDERGPVLTKDGKRKKTFSQRRPADEPNVWINALEGGTFMRKGPGQSWSRYDEDRFKEWKFTEKRDFPPGPDPVMYRLPEVIEAIADDRMVLIVEGEKKADSLWDLGIPATCNAGGSKKWKPEFAAFFDGANAVILPDNDTAGRQHAELVAAALNGTAKKVRVLDLAQHWPAIPPKGDVVDWLAAHPGDAAGIFNMIGATVPWSPRLVSRFGALPFEHLDDAGPEQDYIIDGWFTVGEKSVIGGPSQSGKSFLAIHAAMCAARGTDFFGWKVRAPGLVVYQAGEGVRGIKKRLRAYRKHFSLPPDEKVPFVLLQSKIDLYRADGDTAPLIAELKAIEALYGLPLRMFFIDTLATAQGAADENSGKDMSVVVDNIDRIARETAAHVSLVHHLNAAGTKLRGHTSVYANIDQVVFVTRDEATKVRTAVLDKQKDDETGLRIKFELASIEVGRRHDDDKPITSCVCVQVGEREMLQKKTAAAGFLLRPREEVFFRALLEALKARGAAPNDEQIAAGVPEDVLVAHYTDWRDAYKGVAAPTSEGEAQSDDAIRKWFERELPGLVKYEVIGWQRPWIWWTGKPIRGFPQTQPRTHEPLGQNPDETRTDVETSINDEALDFFS